MFAPRIWLGSLAWWYLCNHNTFFLEVVVAREVGVKRGRSREFHAAELRGLEASCGPETELWGFGFMFAKGLCLQWQPAWKEGRSLKARVVAEVLRQSISRRELRGRTLMAGSAVPIFSSVWINHNKENSSAGFTAWKYRCGWVLWCRQISFWSQWSCQSNPRWAIWRLSL